MKVYKLFTLALAALAFAACSDDEVPNPNPNPDDNWQADIEGLTINFATMAPPKTRAYSGETESKGTEAVIYDAYVFAREANPKHDRGLTGDWTVIKCEVNGDGIVKGESQVENADKTVTLKNVATFHGVRQGDYVYVIANDPNMTLDIAEGLAHKGTQSEEMIKAYTSMLSKEYLGGLAYGKDKTNPVGKFVMAGMAQIPVAPTLPSNGTVELEVGLDRELSKVDFTAYTSSTPSDEAYEVVEFREGDGITVLRIAPTTSMFTERDADFYIPSPTCVENWPINDHSIIENGGFSKFCDQTIPGSVMFDGVSATEIDWNGMKIPANFNTTNPAGNVEEYRYSWVLPAGTLVDGKMTFGSKETDMLYGSSKSIKAPIFYTTPNYSKNTNAVTAVCTQATYIGRDVFMNSGLNAALTKALEATGEKIEFPTADGGTLTLDNPLYVKDTDATGKYIGSIKTILGIGTDKVAKKGLGLRFRVAENDAALNDTLKAHGLDESATYELPKADGTGVETATLTKALYDKMMDQVYTAMLLQYRLANKGELTGDLDGTSSDNNLAASNKVLKDKVAYYYDPADLEALKGAEKNPELLPTDYLLLGDEATEYSLGGTVWGQAAPKFYVYNSAASSSPATWEANFKDFTKGQKARLEYFAKEDAFKYFTNMKLYYRADIADYVDNVSNKMTERNMHYQTVGTIQSLGARTIHDAVYSDENTMKVDVKVNNWKLSINQVPM